MKLVFGRMERAQAERGACCDRTKGPKVLQLSAKDEESGKRYYCTYLEIGPLAEFTVASRDVLYAVANDYVEDVIPYRLECYDSRRPEDWEKLKESAFYPCYERLKAEYPREMA